MYDKEDPDEMLVHIPFLYDKEKNTPINKILTH